MAKQDDVAHRLCTPCTQAQTRLTMRGINTGVWSKLAITKIRSRDLTCERCTKRALFTVTISS